MKIFVVTLLLAACASAGILHVGRSPAVSLLNYYKNARDESRIIDGQPAAVGQFPWQCALTITLSGGSALCGCSLIDSRWVLTAAHCVDGGSAWSVKIGGIHRSVANEEGSVTISSRTGIAHEDYNSHLNNDIALVKLESAVEYSDTIQPIRLPARSEVDNGLENINVIVSGYGKTSDVGGASQDLNFVNLTTISNERCAEVYGSSTIISSTICAVGNPHHSTCNGDSGGPLIRVAEDGLPTLIGVVSFVHSDGCASGNPSGYVRTASFLDWINGKTGIPIRD